MQVETVLLLLAFKVKYPENFFLLRGNHECKSINRMYGFYDECKRRYSIGLWREFCTMFNYLPISAIIDERILEFKMSTLYNKKIKCQVIDLLVL